MKSKIKLYVIDNIKKRRVDKGWSQRYLGDCLNVSQGFIQKIEDTKSDKSYNIDHLNELAKIFKCSIKEFFPDIPL
ncbi:helix-turn-helix domain-containing protein [uncultured Butyricimonas sp.]|uniref:helix-turn-helix domain-containing protein n=1 Tax=uncultured Butyricimonas sp. TaxID=1268785 RepID=UPI0026DADD62|nr:helix-turn-helix transcriptional regulator [uncultured Butyricimonas sp.]